MLNYITNSPNNNIVNQIRLINFKKMKKLFDNSFKDSLINTDKISALKVTKKTNKYKSIGIDLVKRGKYAIVIMAGGNGSRLGFKGPKGCFEFNINNRFISLFESYFEQLKKIIIEYNIVIPIYIMTSNSNYNDTINFFNKNNYFYYPKDKIKFFIQSDLPILDRSGKIVLKDENNILFGPNGNGDVFKSLKKYHLIKDMISNNIKYCLFMSVDNILNDLVDFNFIGATIYNNYKLASKTIKLNNKKEWIFCKYNNSPFMLPSEYLNSNLNIDYYKNISYHLIHINLIKKFSKLKLPYHRAYKKYNYIGSLNTLNSFKFEKFIFDAFNYSDDMLLYEVDDSEFYPLKGIDDITEITKLYIKKYIEK